MVRRIPYILVGRTWTLLRKHEGTGACQTMQGGLSEAQFYTDFVAAGQDAFAIVHFLRTLSTQWNLKQ